MPVTSEMKEVVKRARKGSALSWPRVFATALAAVTMTLVSTRLSSIFGALLVTGIISIGSALAAEFYRLLITITTEGTKKVIAPVIGEDGEQQSSSDESETSERAAAEDNAEEEEAEKNEESSSQPARQPSLTRQIIMFSLIFGLVSLLTIGVSYAVARNQGGDIYNTTVENHPVQQLTDEEKQKLLDLATQASEDGVLDYQTLHDSYVQLKTDNDSLKSTVDELLADQSADQEQIQQLQSEIQSLQSQIDALSTNSVTPTPPTDPNTPEEGQTQDSNGP